MECYHLLFPKFQALGVIPTMVVIFLSSSKFGSYVHRFVEIEFTHYAIHPLKVDSSVLLVYTRSYADITTIGGHCHHPIKKHQTHEPPLPIILSPWQPLICFPFLWICLFWTFHVNGIMSPVVFCVWLLSPTIMSSRFISVVASIRASFHFMAEG